MRFLAIAVTNYDTGEIKVFFSCQLFFFLLLLLLILFWLLTNVFLHDCRPRIKLKISAGNCQHIWVVLRTLSNIYDGAFWVKWLTALTKKTCHRCLIKSIICPWQHSSESNTHITVILGKRFVSIQFQTTTQRIFFL